MTFERSAANLAGLVEELRRLPDETEWVEFKENMADPQEIGEYISALANAAALLGKRCAYLVWGIDDGSHAVVGTSFFHRAVRVGNEELENWLLRLLSPRIDFRFSELSMQGMRVVLLEIQPAARHPVAFHGREYVRVGSYKKPLKDFPEKERELWRVFDRTTFEEGIAAPEMPAEEVLRLLDHAAYFRLLGRSAPSGASRVIEALGADELIIAAEAGGWNITNLGAALFAHELDEFRGLRRKVVRVVQYRGDSRVTTVREHVEPAGYASGFERLVDLINGMLPSNEVIGRALRRSVPMYPELAVRELVANAVVHQDFSVTGAGPMVEIFDDRMEITNPGLPLVATDRFLDTPPRSRNETLASLMRRMGICEERGSGIDKVVSLTEGYQLPAPAFETAGESTRAVLFAHRPLTRMDRTDRVRACYLHACLKFVNRQFLTNASLRDRFGIEARNIASASRLIREAVDAGAIAPYDEAAPPKLRKYVPWWAVPTRHEPVGT